MSSSLTPDTSIGQYTVISKIGEGGMGEVYRARDNNLNRDVAIKVLPPAYSADQERLRRFQQEAQAAGALNHPNILVIYHIGTHEDAPYIASELLEGQNLRERMGGTALSQRKAIDYALQTAHGLAAAHAKGIIHRDLKPENLFITNDGRVKILDFGLAKLTGSLDGASSQTEVPTRRVNTDPGVVMGTIGYMAPEQLRGKPADHRSDIFSFGAILYEMLSGRRAFRGESTADTMSAILREDPPDLSATNKSIAPGLERVVNHCLEKSPEERFHSANDLAFAIEALSGSASVTAAPTNVLSGLPGRKRRELIAWGLTVALLLATITLAALYFGRSPEDQTATRFVVAMPEQTSDLSTPMVSPDGRSIAFVATYDGKRFIFLRRLDSLTAQRLDGTEDASFPFWSPDNQYLGFFSERKLKRTATTGGPPQTLCDASSPGGGTWNREGVILFGLETGPIQRVSAAGGTVTPVLKLDDSRKETGQYWPSFLPDGRHFFYQSWNGRVDDTGIFIASLDGGQGKLLMKNDSNAVYSPPGYLLFARETTLMAQGFDLSKLQLSGEPFPVAEEVTFSGNFSYSNVSVSETGVLVFWSGTMTNRQLAWFDRNGKRLASVGPPGEYNDITLSRDEKRVATQRISGGKSDIWVIDLARGLPSRFTFDGTNDAPIWSPDGSLILFGSARGGPFNFYKKVLSGVGSEERVFESSEVKEATDWSADGKFVIFDNSGATSGSDIWVLPVIGGEKAFPFLQTEFNESQARFSSDGKWVVYNSNESGKTEVYVRSFPQSGGQWQISTSGGAQARWRQDGKEIFYLAPDKKLMAVDVKPGSTFETGTPKELIQTQVVRYDAPNRYAVSVDGQRFLINSAVEEVSQTPITVVLNWTADLKRPK
jgi:serine/threonine protein kinase/Tol biopolymer transport system component